MSEPVPAGRSVRRGRIAVATMLAILALAAFLNFRQLGGASLLAWDEAIYAEVAREAVAEGHWLTLHWSGRPWFEKPPLAIWMMAVSFAAFGVTEFAARVPSALAGLAVVGLSGALGNRLGGRATGLIAAFLVATAGGIIRSSRLAMLDMLLTAAILLGAVAWWDARAGRRRAWTVFGVAVGLAVMIKSVAGLVLPMAALLHGLLSPRGEAGGAPGRRFDRAGWLRAGAVAAAIALPWHLVMLVLHGSRFARSYLGYHVVLRAFDTLEHNQGGLFYYLPVLAAHCAPWGWLCLWGVGLLLLRASRVRERSPLVFPVVVAVTILVLYSAAQTKLPAYVIPVVPFVMLTLAWSLVETWGRPSLASGTCLAVAAVITVAPLARASVPPVAWLLAIAALLVLGLPEPTRRPAAVASTGLALLAVTPLLIAPPPAFRSPAAELAPLVRGEQRGPLVVYPEFEVEPRPAAFYARRHVLGLDSLEGLRQEVERRGVVDALVSARRVDAVEKGFHSRSIARTGDLALVQLASKPWDAMDVPWPRGATARPPLRITGIGPPGTRAGIGFQVQPDGQSALWVACTNADRFTEILFDGRPLVTTFGSETVVTGLVPPERFAKAGTYAVQLRSTGRLSNAVPFTVAE